MTKPKTNPILTKTLATPIGHNRPGNQNRRGGGGTTAHDKLSGQLPSHKLSKNKLPRQAFKLWLLAFVATALIASLFTATPISAQTTSTDATLSGLAVTGAIQSNAIYPAFESARPNYETAVAFGATSLTVAPTATHSAATISINGGTATTGSASEAITISGLSTRINILVTAEDTTTTMAYSILVLRPYNYAVNTEVVTPGGIPTRVAHSPLLVEAPDAFTNTEIDETVRSSDLPYSLVDYELRAFQRANYYFTRTTTAGVGWSSLTTHAFFSFGANRFIARSCTEEVEMAEPSRISFVAPQQTLPENVAVHSVFLPYVRQITLTEDTDDTTTTDTTHDLNTAGTTADYNVCILPEGLENSATSVVNATVSKYTPPTGWVVKDPDIVTLITPSATSTYGFTETVSLTDGGATVASSEVVVSFDPTAELTGNGFSALSVTSTGILDEGRPLECVTSRRHLVLAINLYSLTREEIEVIACGRFRDLYTDPPPTTRTTTFSPSAQPPTLGSLVPGTTNLAVSCGFRLLGQCQNLPDFHSPAIEVNTDVDLFDFSIKAMSPDRPLKEFYLGFGLPRVGAPIQSAKASVTIEIAQNPDSIVGYDIVDVIYQGIENPNAYFWLSLESCSRFSNAICIVASIGDLELYEGFEVEPMAIQVTDTSGETSRYYLAG